jgi:hypothetical protein
MAGCPHFLPPKLSMEDARSRQEGSAARACLNAARRVSTLPYPPSYSGTRSERNAFFRLERTTPQEGELVIIVAQQIQIQIEEVPVKVKVKMKMKMKLEI